MILFFFFFKQKTAYEMRISDWSSDVCSSDLGPRHGDAAEGEGLQDVDAALSGGVDAAALQRRDELGPRHPIATGQRRAGHPLGTGEVVGVQIGRASGRESVCQYV